VAKLADASDLKSEGSEKDRAGSIPARGTSNQTKRGLNRHNLPRGIIERFPNVYQVSVAVQGKRRTGTAHNLPDAIRLRQNLETELHAGSAWTLSEAVARTYQACWKDARSARQLHERALEAVTYFGADTLLSAISSTQLSDYVLSLQTKGNAGATINRKMSALSKVFNYSRKCSDVSGYTLRPHVERQREHQGRIRFVTPTEETTLLKLCDQWDKPDHADAILILIDTGLRPSELWRLAVQDLDLERGLLTIWQSKNATPRTVPMTARVKAVIEKRIKAHPSGQLFPDWQNHHLIKFWNRLKSSMHLDQDEQFVVYCLRHTCASRLVQRGVHLRVVQEWLGHKTLTVTMRYAHLSPTNLIEAVQVLEPSKVEARTKTADL